MEEYPRKKSSVIFPCDLKGFEANDNGEIACARMHIEQMNQRIKLFQILNRQFPWHMIQYMEDIFSICCGFANLGSPTLEDDKFFKVNFSIIIVYLKT